MKLYELTLELRGHEHVSVDMLYKNMLDFLKGVISLADLRHADCVPGATISTEAKHEEDVAKWMLHCVASRHIFTDHEFETSALYCFECRVLLLGDGHDVFCPCEDHRHLFIHVKVA